MRLKRACPLNPSVGLETQNHSLFLSHPLLDLTGWYSFPSIRESTGRLLAPQRVCSEIRDLRCRKTGASSSFREPARASAARSWYQYLPPMSPLENRGSFRRATHSF